MEEDLRDERQVLQQTFQKLTAKVHQEGFREGVEEGKSRSFQKGFDQGYAQGFVAGFSQACFNGALRTLKSVSRDPANCSLEELTAPHRAMCQMCLSTNQKPDSIADLKAWQLSVTKNSELRNKYETLNKVLDSDVINIE